MTKTSIEWATDVWNPVTGCTKVSQGCKNCYAERIAERFWGERKFTDVQLHPDRLEDPMHWKKPRRVFVNSMSDLFHPDVSYDFIGDVIETISKCPQHTFMVLTKRPERMQFIFSKVMKYLAEKPLPNLWLGVSVEDQKTADERIPLLLQTPAAVRFVSCEPLLEPVDINISIFGFHREYGNPMPPKFSWVRGNGLDWVICGGESGSGARPMHPDWARSLRDQCQAASVPFFFKQWGEWAPPYMDRHGYEENEIDGSCTHYPTYHIFDDRKIMERVGKNAAGRLLDGREWNEYPPHP